MKASDDARREVEEIDRKIEELKKRRRELLAELGAGRLSWGAIIAGAFGALMIGLGVIALFAANWDVFGREARAAISVAPAVACGALAIIASARGWSSKALWEPLGILWCISVAAGTCLVAQTYQVGGSVPGLILFVALLMLPVIWFTRAVVPMALWPIFAIAWGMSSSRLFDGGEESLALCIKALALMVLSLPAYVAFVKSRPAKAVFVSAQIATGLVYSFGTALAIVFTMPDALMSEFTGLAIFWSCAALVAVTGRIWKLPVWGMVAIILACATSFPAPFFKDLTGYFIALLIAGAVIVSGVVKTRLSLANIGAVTFLWLVLAKFFESEVSFTLKGLVLIIAGVALTVLNVVLVRFRRKRRA